MPDRSRVKNKLRRERINVKCSCGAELKAPKKTVGKRVRCPKCNKILTVPDTGSPLDQALCALGDGEVNSPALEEQPPPPQPVQTDKGKLCPRCNGEMPRDAVFCIKCGFHIERGTHVGEAGEQPAGNFFTRLFRRR